ncbi:hypothetical protein WDZ92_53745, partial [Nostoc sp. NIES-2111]
AWKHYENLLKRTTAEGYGKAEDFLFVPGMTNRKSALEKLTDQFTAVLQLAALRVDSDGKKRTLYSLRHTAITTAIRQGYSMGVIAANARTSELMINRFYGSHIKGALDMGTEMVDVISAKQRRYAENKKLKRNKLPSQDNAVEAADSESVQKSD